MTAATFQNLLASAHLPPPGPQYFAARRALWITPTTASRLDQTTSTPRIQREGLALKSSGVSDTRFVPLRTVIKIVHDGWRRDGTWPDNATVIDEDNFFGTTDPHVIDDSANADPSLATPEGG